MTSPRSRYWLTCTRGSAAGRKTAMRDRVEHLIQNRDGTVTERSSYGNNPKRFKG